MAWLLKDRFRVVIADPDQPCPFCGAPMQYAESSRYAEWTCTRPPCQGHAAIPLAWLREAR